VESAGSYHFYQKKSGCIFLQNAVNAPQCTRVVHSSQELSRMNNTPLPLSAWPEDERDRKRAPARF